MLIGRKAETKRLHELENSPRSEFVAIYGRRRIGKTHLIKEVFKGRFTFMHTGLANASIDEQLQNFRNSLLAAGDDDCPRLGGWLEAFRRLENLLRGKGSGRKTVFIDEMPWMDTTRSRFIMALEHFWNGFASLRDDVMLMVCGSATSWIMNNVINSHGGLHNRVTAQIYLRPFTLGECELMAKEMRLGMSRRDIMQCYMVLGGVPYYWTLLQRGMSVGQNIDRLCFERGGELVGEFDKLYASLFKCPEPYINIVTALSKKKCGMTRDEIASATGMSGGGKLTGWLDELEQCDFIRRYNMFGRSKKGALFQLTDSFTLFHFQFIKGHTLSDGAIWQKLQGTPRLNTWQGLAFERVCLLHTDKIKRALGISGVLTTVQSWHSPCDGGSKAQIDLLIDRQDGVVNICEMKYCMAEYSIDPATEMALCRKMEAFRQTTGCRKALHLTMVTSYGICRGAHSSIVQSEVKGDDLF